MPLMVQEENGRRRRGGDRDDDEMVGESVHFAALLATRPVTGTRRVQHRPNSRAGAAMTHDAEADDGGGNADGQAETRTTPECPGSGPAMAPRPAAGGTAVAKAAVDAGPSPGSGPAMTMTPRPAELGDVAKATGPGPAMTPPRPVVLVDSLSAESFYTQPSCRLASS